MDATPPSHLFFKADSVCRQGVLYVQQSGGDPEQRHLWRHQFSDQPNAEQRRLLP